MDTSRSCTGAYVSFGYFPFNVCICYPLFIHAKLWRRASPAHTICFILLIMRDLVAIILDMHT